MVIKELEDRWIEICGSGVNKALVHTGFKTLVAQYSEKHRFYHHLGHINACLELCDEVADYIEERFNIEMSIWFHDVIYDPVKFDNEEKSAKYAKKFLQAINLNPVEINKIEHLILLTRHPSLPVTDDEKYLVDIDLSILGANNALYDNYELAIRKEYSLVPSFRYRNGRVDVLKSFAKLDKIFQTEYFYEKLEIQARHNIDRTILALRNGNQITCAF